MASSRYGSYPHFSLTPQQQNLLFAALNSNRLGDTPAANNPQNVSPTSLTESPLPTNGLNSFQDSPFMDDSFDFGDASFDFDLGLDNQPKMIGDLPGTARSDSADNDTSDKRSHPDDDDDDAAGTPPKRRESEEKIAKKPGRKPLTSEPSSKRKAQNRAAQRAFRERKERHLKDLESKVEELQKASEATNNENSLLRAKVDKITVELNEYKKRVSIMGNGGSIARDNRRSTFGPAAINNLSDVNFQFEFPKFGMLPGPPAPSTTSSANNVPQRSPSMATSRTETTTNTGDRRSPDGKSNGTAAHQGQSLDKQTRDDLAKLSGIFSPPLTKNNVNNASRTSIDSAHYSTGGATSTSSPSASSNSNVGASSSCGTSPEPFTQSPMGFKPVDTLTTIGEEQPSTTNPSQDFSQFGSVSDMNDLSWLASQNNFQFDPQLFGGYREPQDNILANASFDNFFDDAFNDIDFTTPYNAVPSATVPKKKDICAEIDAAKENDDTLVPDSEGHMMNCNKIWEQLQSCPKVQNGDFDLDGLCSELQKKAKCSGSGPVVDEQDFNKVMTQYLGKDCTSGQTAKAAKA